MKDTSPLQHSVLGSAVLPVAQALRFQGCDPLEVMAEVGIDAAKLANPDWRITQLAFNKLMAQCVQVTGDEAFGLLAAEQVQPQMLRGLGLAWLASDTVYDGLKRLVRFGTLISTASRLRLTETQDKVHIELGRAPQADCFHDANRDYAVGMIVRMSYLALGEFLAPAQVELQRAVPQQSSRWESLLSCRVAFECEASRVSWFRADIMEPLVTGNPVLARVNDEQAQRYINSFMAQSVAREVVDKIVLRLPDGPPSQRQIAEAMHLSNRTLQRKLKEEGTTFLELLQGTRLQLAQKYLAQPSRSVVETAYLLGFSEPSTFSRAFKRWTGVAPAEYRASPG